MNTSQSSDYPEHKKLRAVQAKSQAQGEFIEWLSSQGIQLMMYDDDTNTWYSNHESIQSLLARYHQIDLKNIETEKRDIIRKAQEIFGEK